MLPTKENGDIISIENVFHSLNTRLSFIKAGITSYGKYYNGNDYPCNPEEAIFDIQSRVHGYSPVSVFGEIEYSLELISRVQELINKIPDEENVDTSDEWYVPTDNTVTIKEELVTYKVYLESLKAELDLRLNSTAVNIKGIENKIPIQITVPQFSMLLSLLCNEDNRTEISKVFDSEFTKLCEAIRTIFKQRDGMDISQNTLYDKKNRPIIKINALKFWSEKFKSYHILCQNLLKENGELRI